MEIRVATKEDFEKFLPTKEEFFREYDIPQKTREFILEEFNGCLKKALVLAIENEKIVGYLAGEIGENPYEKYGYIVEAFVRKEYRRKGISTMLKNKILEILKKQGIDLCRVEVSPSNTSQEAYRKWGFKIDKYRMSLNF